MKRLQYICALACCSVLLMSTLGCAQTLSTKNLKNADAEKPSGISKAATSTASSAEESVSGNAPQSAQVESGSKTAKKPSANSGKKAQDSRDSVKASTKKSTQKDSTKKSSSAKKPSNSKGQSGSSSSSSEDKKITVTVSVDCKTAVEAGHKEALALTKSGTLAYKTLTLAKGSSAFDALKASGLSVSSHEGAMGVYVYAISSLKEKDCGSKSGWLYSVNGRYIGDSCDSTTLKNGDILRWRYTCNGGKDV